MADTWESLNLGDIIPSGVTAVAGVASGTVDALVGYLEAIKVLLNGLETLLVDFADPAAAVVNKLISEVEAEINDFLNTSVSIAMMVPKSLTDKQGTQAVLRKYANSMDNQADPRRPNFGASASVGAVVLLAGGPDVVSLSGAAQVLQVLVGMKSLYTFLDLTNPAYTPEKVAFPGGAGAVTGIPTGRNPRVAFIDLTRTDTVDRFSGLRMRILSGKNSGTTTRVAGYDPVTRTFTVEGVANNLEVGNLYEVLMPQSGRPPYWESVRVGDVFEPFGQVLIALQVLARGLQAGLSVVTGLHAFIAAIDAKADQLQQLALTIKSNIEILEALLQGTGIYVLRLAPQTGGTAVLQQRILAAEGAPDFQSGTHLVISAAMVAGSTTAYDVLTRIF